MPDRERVIKGLKQHRDGRFHSCDKCPYVNNTDCQFKLYSDALILLKKQEKKIKDLEKNLRIDIPSKERNDNFDLYDTPIFGFHD